MPSSTVANGTLEVHEISSPAVSGSSAKETFGSGQHRSSSEQPGALANAASFNGFVNMMIDNHCDFRTKENPCNGAVRNKWDELLCLIVESFEHHFT